MSEHEPFRAQCASCMRVHHDPAATQCPSCGSPRVVVHAGKRTKPEAPTVVDSIPLTGPSSSASISRNSPSNEGEFLQRDQPAAAPQSTIKPHRPLSRFDPRPVAETCDICGAPPGTVCDLAEHRNDPTEIQNKARSLRETGMTYSSIGKILGVSRQRAQAAAKARHKKNHTKPRPATPEVQPLQPRVPLLAPSPESGQPLVLTVYEALLEAEKRGDAGVTRKGPHLVADLSVVLAILEGLEE